MHDCDRIRSRLIQLAMNHRFVGRLESGFLVLIPAVEIGDDDIAWLGEKQAGFFRSAATDQHVLAAETRAHVAGSFLEHAELGENAARQRNFAG